MKEPYKEWAETNISRIRGVLDKSRSEHTQAVKDRINSVEQMKDAVSLTEGLFAVSKVHTSIDICTQSYAYAFVTLQETAQLEAESFVQGQKVALAAEAKAVLDSWVRFEQQAKEAEQAELAKSVIAKVMATVRDEKTQREILNGAIAEIERKQPLFLFMSVWLTVLCRTRQDQSHLDLLFSIRFRVEGAFQ